MLMQFTCISSGTIVLFMAGLLLLGVIFILLRRHLRSRRRNIGFIMSGWHLLFVAVAAVSVLLWCHIAGDGWIAKAIIYLFAMSVLGATIFTLWRYKRIFKYDVGHRHRFDAANHWLQLSILLSVAVFIVMTVCFFRLSQDRFLPFSIFAVVLTWLFQDAVLGVAAYIHLRVNRLIHIRDLINIPDRGITGYVSDVSLVSVTIDTLDNTQATIPLVTLQKGSFINLQNMLDGNTSGRRLVRSFVIDSNSVTAYGCDEIDSLAATLECQGEDTIALTSEKEKMTLNGCAEVLNVSLFRRYLRHWLCSNYEVARSPRMIVCLDEPTVEGVRLKVYTYVKKTPLEVYEHISSDITEHVLHSMKWFGLRLYQRPASNDLKPIETASAHESV